MTVSQLETVAIGLPITRLGVSFFPVYLAANDPPPIATGEASGLIVDELDEASVQTLRVRNPRRQAGARRRGRALHRRQAEPRPQRHRPGAGQGRAGDSRVLSRAGSLGPPPGLPARRGVPAEPGPRRATCGRIQVHGTARLPRRRPVGGLARGRPDAAPRLGGIAHRRRGRDAPTDVPSRPVSCRRGREARRKRAASRPVRHRRYPRTLGCRGWTCSAHPICSPFTGPRSFARTCSSHPSCTVDHPPRACWSLPDASLRHRDRRRPAWGLGVERRLVDKRLIGQALTLDGAVVHAAFFTGDPVPEA